MPGAARNPHAGAMSEATVSTKPHVGAAVLWVLAVFGGLVLMGDGLLAGVFFENTSAAVADAERGLGLVVAAGLLLAGCAAWARLAARMPVWILVAVVAPTVVTGGLAVGAPETLFGLLSAVVTFPAALAGAVGGLVSVARRG
jgi:hypothetical protein